MQTCPACGSPMQLRTARRGPNAGSQFWGCSRYPACKATVEFRPIPPDVDPAVQTTSLSATPRVFPVHVVTAPREPQGQSAFFQACGLPEAFVEHLHMAGADRSLIRAAAQWRLDFPLPNGEGVPPEDRNVMAVAESLLTRGATPLCSPSLERILGAAAMPTDEAEPVIVAMRVSVHHHATDGPITLKDEGDSFHILKHGSQQQPGGERSPKRRRGRRRGLMALCGLVDEAGRHGGDTPDPIITSGRVNEPIFCGVQPSAFHVLFQFNAGIVRHLRRFENRKQRRKGLWPFIYPTSSGTLDRYGQRNLP